MRRDLSAPVVDSTADFPASRDYDGDGLPDPAVWRPWGGVWLIDDQSDGLRIERLGQPGDIPAAADYDADGRAEPAIWRPDAATLETATTPARPVLELPSDSLRLLSRSLYLLAHDLWGQNVPSKLSRRLNSASRSPRGWPTSTRPSGCTSSRHW